MREPLNNLSEPPFNSLPVTKFTPLDDDPLNPIRPP